ncbi:hypothetical protein SCLARK_001808 [Spiroplasma clarkii]|uniref:Citrate lyase subunit gamma (Acyl carrier protein) n=1 Tax=Spiroplasma clarkii TaxID=2139 RepID=A0A1Y0L2N9_9MOLU|nr:citrate lyase acyl carrier protein [Spiroplasma clarkii]ARU92253.1 hypothetical protein SCLARK_001808 [Spiroplasma clarkii]ATX71570.1 citrate lyase subunit gamma (acyl carrier protein) [Spiroplasma clarkii]
MTKDKKIIVGSVESGDMLVTITPTTTQENEIIVDSKFIQQFGEEIKTIVAGILKDYKVNGVLVEINDQGAIPAVIRARVKTGIERYLAKND